MPAFKSEQIASATSGLAPAWPEARVFARRSMRARTISVSTTSPMPAAWLRTTERWRATRWSTSISRLASAPKPVEIPQLMRAAALSDTDGSTLTSEASLARSESENVPSWVMRLRGLPSRWYRH